MHFRESLGQCDVAGAFVSLYGTEFAPGVESADE